MNVLLKLWLWIYLITMIDEDSVSVEVIDVVDTDELIVDKSVVSTVVLSWEMIR